jgi:cobalamin biosynthetic protein CobC
VLHDWLDLSTGINPRGYPVQAIPARAWQRLPEPDDGLEAACLRYFGAPGMLACAGSQAAIQALPGMFRPCRVGILRPTYAEHPHAWQSAGHTCVRLAAHEIHAALPALDMLVLANPNNPDGAVFSRETLLGWHAGLVQRGGWLVVDEAFMDATPGGSLLPEYAGQAGLIVLRSLGKFFGLAGARVGFVSAPSGQINQLAELLGPWAIPGPSREAACQALEDVAWQQHTRQRLEEDAARLAGLLGSFGLAPAGGSALFQWVPTPLGERIYEGLARQGVLVRRFENGLRIGLPDAEGWARLELSLKALA